MKKTKVEYGNYHYRDFCEECNIMNPKSYDDQVCYKCGHSNETKNVYTVKHVVRSKTSYVQNRFLFWTTWEEVSRDVDFKDDNGDS